MAELHDSITRDCQFLDTKDGKHYFLIIEHGKQLYQSDLFDDQDKCCKDGIAMLDFLQQKKPLRCDTIPSTKEYGVKYSG